MRKILLSLIIFIALQASGQLEPKYIVNRNEAGPSVKIRMHCNATLTQNDYPLVVVDGIPIDFGKLENINPDEIITINILKNNSASALYGCRAMNGVILITTKNGMKRKLVINDETDGSPVAGASVSVVVGSDTSFLVADKNGFVYLDKKTKHQDYKVEVSCVGYEKKTIWLSNSQNEAVILRRKVTPMDSVVIVCCATIRCGRCRGTCISTCNGTSVYKYTEPGETILKSFIFPNPARSGHIIQIKISTPFRGKIQLYNLAGQEVQSRFMETGKVSIINYMLPSVPAGNYIIRLIDERQVSVLSEKIIVQ